MNDVVHSRQPVMIPMSGGISIGGGGNISASSSSSALESPVGPASTAASAANSTATAHYDGHIHTSIHQTPHIDDAIKDSVLSLIAWISSYAVYLCFVVWAFFPKDFLRNLGITYYPSRYYAIALPAYLLTSYALLCVAYIGWNMMHTNDPEDFATMRDEQSPAVEVTPILPPVYVRSSRDEGIAGIGDIDPIALSRVMNLRGPFLGVSSDVQGESSSTAMRGQPSRSRPAYK